MRKQDEINRLRSAISWLEPPFVDSGTPNAALRKRIQFMLEDVKRLDAALAAGSRRAKTAQPVECEASQSGGEAVTPTPSGSDPQEKVGI